MQFLILYIYINIAIGQECLVTLLFNLWRLFMIFQTVFWFRCTFRVDCRIFSLTGCCVRQPQSTFPWWIIRRGALHCCCPPFCNGGKESHGTTRARQDHQDRWSTTPHSMGYGAWGTKLSFTGAFSNLKFYWLVIKVIKKM